MKPLKQEEYVQNILILKYPEAWVAHLDVAHSLYFENKKYKFKTESQPLAVI